MGLKESSWSCITLLQHLYTTYIKTFKLLRIHLLLLRKAHNTCQSSHSYLIFYSPPKCENWQVHCIMHVNNWPTLESANSIDLSTFPRPILIQAQWVHTSRTYTCFHLTLNSLFLLFIYEWRHWVGFFFLVFSSHLILRKNLLPK